MKQRRIFIDLDGPTVDFDRYMRETGLSAEEIKRAPGSYLKMKPTVGAIEAIRMLISWGYEVWIATKPPTGISYAYADKAQWVMNNLPELTRRIILTHDKGLLGDQYDYLIDDRPHKANCQAFKGMLIHYRDGQTWPQILNGLKQGVFCGVDPANAAGDRTVMFGCRQIINREVKQEPYWIVPKGGNND